MYTLSDKIVDQNITHFCPKKKKKNVKNFNLQNFLLWTYFLVGLNYSSNKILLTFVRLRFVR